MKSLLLLSALALSSISAQAQTAALQPDAAAQKALTSEGILKDLFAGNARYVDGKNTVYDAKSRRKAAQSGQYPKAYVLSCVDSRVPVEQVFDQGIGDIFVGRVAGNIENVDQLGSMEYATAVAGVKVLMVMGHEGCGAVKSACDHVEVGNVTALLDQIEPAIEKVKGYKKEEMNSKNKEFVNKVIETNVKDTIADIRKRSKIIADLEKGGKLKIVGGVYSLKTGKVTPVE